MKDVGACDKLRGTGKQVLIRRSLNGETRCGEAAPRLAEYIGKSGERGELKHLSTRRKRKQL